MVRKLRSCFYPSRSLHHGRRGGGSSGENPPKGKAREDYHDGRRRLDNQACLLGCPKQYAGVWREKEVRSSREQNSKGGVCLSISGTDRLFKGSGLRLSHSELKVRIVVGEGKREKVFLFDGSGNFPLQALERSAHSDWGTRPSEPRKEGEEIQQKKGGKISSRHPG